MAGKGVYARLGVKPGDGKALSAAVSERAGGTAAKLVASSVAPRHPALGADDGTPHQPSMKATGPGWQRSLALQVAPHVRDYTLVSLGSGGVITIGKSYEDRRTAFAQRTRRENAAEASTYVVTHKGGRVVVYTGATARLIAVDVPET